MIRTEDEIREQLANPGHGCVWAGEYKRALEWVLEDSDSKIEEIKHGQVHQWQDLVPKINRIIDKLNKEINHG